MLEAIVERTRRSLSERRRKVPLEQLRSRPLYAEARRPFGLALRAPGRRVIAEVKRASPSRGPIRPDADPARLAQAYERGGAAAISVLTEPHYFAGDLADIERVRAATALPVLRKDFILDAYQIVEARAAGADAVLLIAAVLGQGSLHGLLEEAGGLGLEALTEVHDEAELELAVAAGARLLGINNRDLRTFTVSPQRAERLLHLLPPEVTAVVESGLSTPAELARYEAAGVHAFLIGEALMTAGDPAGRLQWLVSGRPS